MTTELFKLYRQNPSRQLRDRIFNHHYKLACEIAHQFRVCCSEPLEDLIQLAAMGLVTAIERFDPDRGNAFSSFACPYIKGEICHYLRDKSSTVKIPRSLQTLYKHGRKLQDEYGQQGILLTDKQTAIALGVDELKWRDAKTACTNHQHVSIDSLLTATEPSVAINRNAYRSCTEDAHIAKLRLSLDLQLTSNDKQIDSTAVIETLPLDNLDDKSRRLLEMMFFENQPLKEVRRGARAVGIKAKDVKPMLLNAVLSLA
ncbi:MAG: sigma-70 family RNA polymerase sigma factor [Desmonostoc geniculatum HA4340-LM1]|jgi:RNA polymerase sigma-B factor|nr:sigma-70 family RNA polymerase sigma factor [Desmonostoc geniculatum HA4340-LM1]